MPCIYGVIILPARVELMGKVLCSVVTIVACLLSGLWMTPRPVLAHKGLLISTLLNY